MVRTPLHQPLLIALIGASIAAPALAGAAVGSGPVRINSEGQAPPVYREWVTKPETAVKIATAVLEAYLGQDELKTLTKGRPLVAHARGDRWVVHVDWPNVDRDVPRDGPFLAPEATELPAIPGNFRGPVVVIGRNGLIERVEFPH